MARTPLSLLTLTVVAGLPCSCLPTAEISTDAATPPLADVHAFDMQGHVAALDRLPRRPRLLVRLGVALDAKSDAPWLLAGAADAALLADLDKLPLSAAHRARRLATRRRVRGKTIEVEPLDPLTAGAEYTLAVPRTAAKLLSAPLTADLCVDAAPEAGAQIRATFPPADATGVPFDLAAALITFDGVVLGVDNGIWLEDAAGLAHPGASELVACSDYDHAATNCVRWRAAAPLLPSSRYTLRSGRALTDAHGAPIPELHAAFTTQAPGSTGQPAWQAVTCAVDEQDMPIGCAEVGDQDVVVRLFQNPLVRVVADLEDQHVAVLPGDGDMRLRFSGLTPASEYSLRLVTSDARLRTMAMTWTTRTAPPLPTLSISEVKADPAGREPDQEYVELWNYGDKPLDLDGLLLSDSLNDLGSPIQTDIRMEPSARVLLVSDAYDATDPADVNPSPGCLLVRMGKALTRGGLSNAGEALYLRTAEGHRVSMAPDSPAPKPGQCLVRASDDPRSGEPADFERSSEACSPGR